MQTEQWYDEPVSLTLQTKEECIANPQESRTVLVLAAREVDNKLEIYDSGCRVWAELDSWEVINVGNSNMHFARLFTAACDRRRYGI